MWAPQLWEYPDKQKMVILDMRAPQLFGKIPTNKNKDNQHAIGSPSLGTRGHSANCPTPPGYATGFWSSLLHMSFDLNPGSFLFQISFNLKMVFAIIDGGWV